MGRSLPRAHPDDEDALRKQRHQVFKRFYQAYYEWLSLRQTGQTTQDSFIGPNGEEVYFPDLLTGYPYLPRRQQQSFEYICLRSYTEAAATEEIYRDEDGDTLDGDGNAVKRNSTVVQQYARQALERMISAYDEVQAGTWDPIAVMKTRKLNGRSISHDPVAARRNRLDAGVPGRRDAGHVPQDVHHRGGEDRVLHRGPTQAALGP